MTNHDRVSWYRRRLTVAQLVGGAAAAGVPAFIGGFLLAGQGGARWASGGWEALALTVVLGVACWPLFGDASRWAPRLGLSLVTAGALLLLHGRVVLSLLALLLAVVGFLVEPRPHRRLMGVCALGVLILTAVGLWEG